LTRSGSDAVAKKTMTFEVNQVRQTPLGFTDSYSLNADVYLPEGLTQPAPLAVLTHGFTSDRTHFQYVAEHLASHGYVVLVPEHIGSNSEYKEAFLRGELSVDVSPLEFASRPLDITYLLDIIENHEEFQGLIDWSQVGVLGHSFGGNTALVVSGAPLNQTRISQVCQENQLSLNPSILLQCRASSLPPGEYNQRDPRIKAAVAVNPVTSSILGPESMRQIAIPTMILAGNEDIVAPFVEEQAHPFLWLNTENKYLGVMVVGSHNSTSSEEGAKQLPDLLKGVRPDLARGYLKAMSLAFFEVHLRDRTDYEPYLSAAYARAISSDKDLIFYLVQSLTSEQLEQAHGDTPPTPPIPESLVAVSPKNQEDVLAEIEKTKTLKVAMRSDAAPFGYITPQGLWTGYCEDLANSLGEHLAQKLNIDSEIEVIKLPSNLDNRFELVSENTVHLECGPNSIQSDREDVSFSDFFFASGSQFLVTNDSAAKIDFDNGLEGVQVGVLPETTTDLYVRETYPQANITYFEGKKGRTEAVKAVTNGSIDGFVSDGVLLLGEIDRQNLSPENYQLVPEKPLTCDFYGLILPEGDTQWHNTVNAFLRGEQVEESQHKWLGEYFPQAVSNLDYCIN
jgi:predicted dienelactone hydrolase